MGELSWPKLDRVVFPIIQPIKIRILYIIEMVKNLQSTDYDLPIFCYSIYHPLPIYHLLPSGFLQYKIMSYNVMAIIKLGTGNKSEKRERGKWKTNQF